ncbi:hypothetical protein Tco_1019231 [Tanacetum coccineum]|uniref:Uncharacterized protein n=1 Tax=Tanacetum coccineum TaxID=301880 RepID=A0ABQ5FWM3_9ASTR
MAMCHLLSGATWPVSHHQSHRRTTGQRRSTVAVNSDQRRSTVANHRLPSPDHRRSTTGQRWLTASQQAGQRGRLPCGTTWQHVAAEVEIPKGAIAESNSGPPEYKLKGCP